MMWTGPKEGLNLGLALQKKAPEILEEIKNTYFAESLNHDFAFIKEILLNGKIIGISAYKFSLEHNLATMKIIYVLEKFRGKNFLYNEIKDIIENFKYNLSIDCPNQYVINSLIENELAIDIGNNLVISKIPLSFAIMDAEEVESGGKLFVSSPFYDRYLSRVICFDDDNFELPLLSPILDVDIRDFNALENNMKIDEEYLNNIKSIFEEKINELYKN